MTKYFSLIPLIIFLGTGNEIFAQAAAVKGTVIEKTGNVPLEGATIALYLQSDSTIVRGTVTDSIGRFEVKSVSDGNYTIEISFLGFITYRMTNVSISGNKDIGTISLEPSEILLDAVNITGEKLMLTNHLDKKVYDVGKDLSAASGSASEILQNIPSVSVDINGGISLRNATNVTIFINGKPSAMLRRGASSVLEQIPASSIERIEIITNPSAKYRPDGVGGIINIVLKKEIHKGFNGQVAANAGTENRWNGNLNLNYGTEKLKFFSNYGIRHSPVTYLYTDERTYKEPESGIISSKYSETGDSKVDALSHNIFAGINYKINNHNNVELSGTYFSQNSLHKGYAEIFASDSVNNPSYRFANNQTNDEFEKEGEANFSYEHIFKNKEDHSLTLEAAYAAFNEQEDLAFSQNYTLPSSAIELSSILIQKRGNQEEVILNYTLPVGEDGEFESGYAGELVSEDIRYNKNGSSSRFLFTQEIHALYALYGHSFDKFSFKAGLRAEQAYITSHLKIPADSLIPNNYFKLFPTLHLGYEFSDSNQVSLSYSKRLNRPDADELNPNPEFSDPRNAESGNPGLKPEQVHSVEFGHQATRKKMTWTSTLYYRYTYDAFTSIQSNIGDTVVWGSIANLKTEDALGLEIVLSGKIFPKWSFDLTGDVFYTTIDAANLGYASAKSTVSGNLKLHSQVKLAKNTSLQLDAFYYFPTITPQGNRNQFFYMNGGLKYQLFKNRASLTLTATDILHTYQVKHIIQSDELDQTSTIQRKLPVVYLGFTWRFNNYKAKDNLEFEGEGLKK